MKNDDATKLDVFIIKFYAEIEQSSISIIITSKYVGFG